MKRTIICSGEKFGRWVATGEAIIKNSHTYHECRCTCGVIKYVLSANLINGTSASCGCATRERVIEASTTHGQSKGRLYRIWQAIKGRCLRPGHHSYKRYGAIGITVCREWVDGWERFRDWALENGYQSGLTIDRINNDLGYSPNNCRWVNLKVQANNKRNNVKITAFGETKGLSGWVGDKRCVVSRDLLDNRIRQGWTPERALTEVPDRRPRRFVSAFGEQKIMSQWVRDSRCVVARKALERRLNAGWSSEMAITTPVFSHRKNS